MRCKKTFGSVIINYLPNSESSFSSNPWLVHHTLTGIATSKANYQELASLALCSVLQLNTWQVKSRRQSGSLKSKTLTSLVVIARQRSGMVQTCKHSKLRQLWIRALTNLSLTLPQSQRQSTGQVIWAVSVAML